MASAPPLRTNCSPSSRLRWSSVALAVGLVLSSAACGSSGGEADVEAEIGSGVSVVVSTTTVTADTVASTTSLPPTVGTPDPQTTAGTLYLAWVAGDRGSAAVVAEPAAIDDIWATAPGEYSLYNRCSTGEFGGAQCLYRGPGGTIQFSMDEVDGNWVVKRAIFSPA